MRIMAIDYGMSRIGVAMTDPQCVISQPLLTLEVKSLIKVIERLKFIIEENKVGLVLVGNPLSHHGTPTKMSEKVKEFVGKLSAATGIEIKLWDERFTSRHALNVARDIGLKRKDAKIDQIAASIMLDEYLKSQSLEHNE